MDNPQAWRFLTQVFPNEIEEIVSSEVLNNRNPKGDDRLLADLTSPPAKMAKIWGIDPATPAKPMDEIWADAPDPFDGCLADDVPARPVFMEDAMDGRLPAPAPAPTDAEIDRVARLNRAAPDLLKAVGNLLDIIHDDLTHARQADHAVALAAANAAYRKAVGK